jgi:hypothetical protein
MEMRVEGRPIACMMWTNVLLLTLSYALLRSRKAAYVCKFLFLFPVAKSLINKEQCSADLWGLNPNWESGRSAKDSKMYDVLAAKIDEKKRWKTQLRPKGRYDPGSSGSPLPLNSGSITTKFHKDGCD